VNGQLNAPVTEGTWILEIVCCSKYGETEFVCVRFLNGLLEKRKRRKEN
jgi:hypothetical protein